jgi:alpha-amylase/alpha-mannosidase (GH57 family)
VSRIVVHGHFYQPPRENPWTGRIDAQPSAAPFHDWNERVHAECYRPTAFSTIPTEPGHRVVNNFERLSFNVGPTLLAWMEKADSKTYGRIIEADRLSLHRLGHGNALAQAFHHTILPLSTLRDVRTQVRWGLADFRYRFGRDPEGMWLPETAASDDVLGVLIEEGVRFTILAPGQSHGAVDTRLPHRYLHRDGSGRSLSLFFYDADIARSIAFERAGSSAEGFIDLFESRPSERHHLVHAATDGETYGHHQVFTDLGLAYALFVEAERRGIEVTNYGAYLDGHPPQDDVKVRSGEGSSWSCAHGVGRWKRDCGCSTGGEPGWNQNWRGPLRAALEIVRDAADEVFQRIGGSLFNDPWEARDHYVDVVIGRTEWDALIAREASGPLDDAAKKTAHALLELQESSMSMFTSCGWFFNDIGGIETIQILRYAARTLDLMKSLDQTTPENALLDKLEQAKSNDPEVGTGADVYRQTLDRDESRA